MSFKDMVAQDNANVFMDCNAFAEEHTIIYDGVTYDDVKCVISQLKEQDRKTAMSDHAQGLYLVNSILHCSLVSLGGNVPEKGSRLSVGDGSFMRAYYVAASGCDMDMIRVELEAIDE